MSLMTFCTLYRLLKRRKTKNTDEHSDKQITNDRKGSGRDLFWALISRLFSIK